MESKLKALYKELIEDRKEEVRDWHDRYRDLCGQVDQIRKRIQSGVSLSQTDEEFLKQLIYKKHNGIANSGQSYINEDTFQDFIKNSQFLSALEQFILTPNEDNFIGFGKAWSDHGGGEKLLLVNRVAAASTRQVSTAVDYCKFCRTFDRLVREEIIPKYTVGETRKDFLGKIRDWYSKNTFFLKFIKEEFAAELQNNGTDEFYLGIFVWKVCAYYEELLASEVESIPPGWPRRYGACLKVWKYCHDNWPKAKTEKIEIIEQEINVHPATISAQRIKYARWREEQGTVGEDRENFSAIKEPNVARSDENAYSVEDIIKDGCFLDRSEIDRVLARLRTKKNLILQGPPGTGKTWLAKRLAFALIGRKDAGKVRAVQFHPNLSYEDFVRGWRPTGEGKLSLTDGVFMESIKAALDDPSSKFVVVIEEINRGNPAQIFGELLTLLEADKRTPDEALELCYPDADGKRRPVHIPENLYVVGTMNVADRSLAMVDLALRRRFAFVELEPKLGKVWRDWVVKERAVESTLAADIERRISELNVQIAADKRLGKQFRIGHSYVTPTYQLDAGGTKEWFRQVVETEIAPLLDEYWFDAPDEAQEATKRLTQGW